MAHDAGPGAPIFEGVYFVIIPSPSFSLQDSKEVTKKLKRNGATECTLGSHELKHVTHLISTTSDFPAYNDAIDAFIHVVKPSWVDSSVFKGRATNPRQYSPDPRLFFSDVVIACADDIPQGDKDAIIGGVHAMGGIYSSTLSKLVTHVVALSMNNDTCQVIVNKRLKCKPVLPHWFDACLRLGKKIDCEPYVLPEPTILSSSKSAPTNYHHPDLEGAAQLEPEGALQALTPPISPSKDRRNLSVFNGRKVMLHDDLNLSDHLRTSLSMVIVEGEGSAVQSVDDADILICYDRESSEFKSASRDGKDVGNLNWLYYLINHNLWTSPTRRLLHYPYPRNGIPGFSEFRITVSNYTGDARVYLESLVKAAGGNFTKSMVPENTHLITAHTFSEKCEAAMGWNINMINHLWLEESYARCKLQSVTDSRYTTFPEQTNLGEVVGQTQIDRDAVEKYHYPQSPTLAGQVEINERGSSTMRTPFQSSVKKTVTQTPGMRNTSAKETPAGSRGAKNRALNRLHEMASDIALYQKESKRRGGVVYGGRRVNDPDRIAIGQKRASDSEVELDEDSNSDNGESTPVPSKKQKRPKLGSHTEVEIKVLLTGWDGRDQPTLKSKAKALKIAFTDNPTEHFDVLVAPKILRTRKFLSGIAKAPAVVDLRWLTEMVSKEERLPYEDYLLKDTAYEKSNELNLAESLNRAKENKDKGGMLRGWTIFCTENAHGSFEAHNEIIRSNGGRCSLYKGRETIVGKDPRSTFANDDEDDAMSDAEKGDLFLITALKDKGLWGRFREMAESQGFTPVLCKADWMLRIALTQDIDEWNEDWEWTANEV